MTKIVTVAADELEALVERAVIRALSAAHPAKPVPSPRPMSLRRLAKEYGVGRQLAMEDIRAGRLPCVERRCPGGRMGVFISPVEAERLYGGQRR